MISHFGLFWLVGCSILDQPPIFFRYCSPKLPIESEVMRLLPSGSPGITVDAEETTRYSQTFDLAAALREQAAHPMWGTLLWKVLVVRCGFWGEDFQMMKGYIDRLYGDTMKNDADKGTFYGCVGVLIGRG